jgi:hypothetical protein
MIHPSSRSFLSRLRLHRQLAAPSWWTILAFAVVAAGMAYRLSGIAYGVPAVSHEEIVTLGQAWQMYYSGNPDPHWFAWPGLLIYVQLGLFRLLMGIGIDRWSQFVVASRCLQAIVGGAVVWMVYRIGSKFYGGGTGLAAAVLLAGSAAFVTYSRLARPEMMVPLLFLSTGYASWRLLRTGRIGYYAAAGILAGLAAAFKYNGAFAIFVPVAVHLVRVRRCGFRFPFSVLPILGTVALAAAVFFAANPYILLDQKIFIRSFTIQEARSGWQALYLSRAVSVIGSGLGIPMAIAAIFGVVRAVIRRDDGDVVLLFMLAASLLLFMGWSPSTRLMLTALAVLLLLGARIVAAAMAGFRRRVPVSVFAGAIGCLWAALLWYPMAENIRQSRELSRTSVTDQVSAWVRAHVRPGSGIFWGENAPMPVDFSDSTLEYGLNGDIDPHEKFANNYDKFLKNGYAYVILSLDYRRIVDDPEADSGTRRFYERLYRGSQVMEFPWDRRTLGAYSAPYSQIFRDTAQMDGTVYVIKLATADKK